jgi:UDP-N-acetylmuramate dehydrogenase
MAFGDELVAAFGADRVRAGVRLAPFTTFKIGGPAEWFVELRTSDELARAVVLAREAGRPLTILGGGSNVLVADRGVAGLVVRVHGGEIRMVGEHLVRADAGVTVNGLVRWAISRGLAGLERWAGLPGTVGGAVYGNAHFEGRSIDEAIVRVGLVDPEGTVRVEPAEALAFAYDFSRLQRTREVVVWVEFRVEPGDREALREAARRSLRFRKQTQPLHLPSAGCVFQNPDPARDPVPAGLPAAAGALIDAAGLKGARVGGAMVSPVHANFFVNVGGATAGDVRALIERCRSEVDARFGVRLREEIVYLGEFDAAAARPDAAAGVRSP